MGRRREKKKFPISARVLIPSLIASLLGMFIIYHVLSSSNLQFNKKEAYAHLSCLTKLGPRPSGSRELITAEDYIVSNLRKRGFEVTLDSFISETPLGDLPMKNICGLMKGARERIIILAAHYETKYFPEFPFVGANDNASGVALLLELGRVISMKNYSHTLWLLFFDGEEAFIQWSPTDGTYGSRRFATKMKEEGLTADVRAMILVDMVGDRDLNINLDSNSTPWLKSLMTSTAKELGLQRFFSGEEISISDDHIPMLQAGIPSLDIIDMNYQYWHTSGDTPENVSEESIGITGQVVEKMLDKLDKM